MKITKDKASLTEDQLKKLKREVLESMCRNRHSMLNNLPFVGNVAMRFDLVPVRDVRVATACTDFKSIYFDIDFYLSLSPEERIFVFAHEVFHTVALSALRRQSRDYNLWNVATDMEINNILANSASGLASGAPPKNVLFPPRGREGQSAETLYDWLIQQQKAGKLNKALNAEQEAQSGSSQGRSKSKGNSGNSGDSSNSEEELDTSNDGSNTGKLEGQFDKHVYADGEGEDGSDGGEKTCTDRWGEKGLDEDFKPSVPSDAAERIREAAIAAAQACERQYGELPAGIESLVGKLAKPQVSWRDELARFVTTCYGGSRLWLPPNRRRLWNDGYFQSRRSERINIAVAVDTSGSTLNDLGQFFGELKGLVSAFDMYDLHLIYCDAEVDFYKKYDESDPLVFDEDEISYLGGGGTSFDPPFKFIEDNSIQVDVMVYLTDGCGPCTVDEPSFPVMWLVTRDGDEDFCTWGKKIRFKESSWD